jgi:hypothetical protein
MMGNEESQSGGLGAALSQYSSSADVGALQPDNRTSNRITRKLSSPFLASPAWAATTAFQQERSRVQSPLFPAISQFHERSTRAMSPMLIPPVSQTNIADPPDIVRPEESSSGVLHRPVPIDNGSLQPRDGLASLGVLSGSNYEYGGVVQNSVVSFVRRFLCFLTIRCVSYYSKYRH